jgi:hypothetical protein
MEHFALEIILILFGILLTEKYGTSFFFSKIGEGIFPIYKPMTKT